MDFDWDPNKARRNLQQHGIAFAEAATVFADDFAWTFFDPDHAQDEDRFITIGTSNEGRLLFVSHTDVGDRIRLISAREVTRRERKAYESYHD